MGSRSGRRRRLVVRVGVAVVGLLALAAPAWSVFGSTPAVVGNAIDTATLEPPTALTASSLCGQTGLQSISTVAPGASTSTVTVPTPSGVAADQLLLAQLTWHDHDQTGSVSAPSGWTLIRGDDDGGEVRQWLFYKVAGASEPASYTFTSTSSDAREVAAVIAAYGGVNTSAPIDAHGGQFGSSAAMTAPSITTSTSDTLLLAFFGQREKASIAPPPGMVERWELNAVIPSVEAADQIRGPSGATGTRTATSSKSREWVAQLVALRMLPVPSTITFRDGGTGIAAAGTSMAIGKPPAATAGDVLVAVVYWDEADSISPPAGWTHVRTDHEPTDNWRQSVFWKLAGSSEPINYTFTATGSSPDEAVGIIGAYRGVHPTAPIDAHGGQAQVAPYDDPIRAPSITTTVAGTMLLGFFGSTSVGNITPPPGMTERRDVQYPSGDGAAIELADEGLASSGPTGARTAQQPGVGNLGIGQLIALRPASGGSGSQNRVSLAWTPSVSAFAEGYTLRRWQGAALESTRSISPGGASAFIDGPVVSGATYRYDLESVYASWTSTVTSVTTTPVCP